MPSHPGSPSRRASTSFPLGLLGAVLLLATATARAQPPESPFRPEARELFAGCKPQADGPTGRGYSCPRFMATFAWIPVSVELSERQLLESLRTGMAVSLKGEPAFEPVRLKLAGREVEALRVTVREKPGAPVHQTGHLTVEKKDGGAWMYFCLGLPARSGESKECGKVLEFFATTGAPEPIDLKTLPRLEKPVLFSRELVVPEGCELAPPVPNIGRIQCPSSFLTWATVNPAPDVRKWLQESTAMIRKQLQVEVNERPVECTVGQLPATCVQLVSTAPGKRFRITLGVTQQGQQGTQVCCGLMTGGATLPPVCNGVLEVLSQADGGK